MIQVIVYSNQPILLAGMGDLMAADPLLEFQGGYTDFSLFRDRLANDDIDLAVVDLGCHLKLDALSELKSAGPHCRLILWADSIAADFALQAVRLGVRGILRKTLTVDAHLQCLYKISAGEVWFEKSLTDQFSDIRRIKLSPRESQLVTLLSRGLKNKEIAAELGLTEGTVKVYLAHLFQKSGVKDRLELAKKGMRVLDMDGSSVSERVQSGRGNISPCYRRNDAPQSSSPAGTRSPC